MHDLIASHAPVIVIKDARALTTSRDVAATFEKKHDDVLRKIRALIALEPSLALRNFAEGSYSLLETGDQRHLSFDIDRDGFALLAMGFTGSKALKWKIQWIQAFNAMEAELLKRTAPLDRELSSSGSLQPGQALIPVGKHHVLIDTKRFERLRENDRAVVVQYDGRIAISQVSYDAHPNWFGRRSAQGPWRKQKPTGVKRSPVQVLGVIVDDLHYAAIRKAS